MAKDPFSICIKLGGNIISWVLAFIALRSVANLKINNFFGCPVNKLMSDTARGESGAHAGFKLILSFVGDQYRMTFNNIDEFVLLGMSMQQRRFSAG